MSSTRGAQGPDGQAGSVSRRAVVVGAGGLLAAAGVAGSAAPAGAAENPVLTRFVPGDPARVFDSRGGTTANVLPATVGRLTPGETASVFFQPWVPFLGPDPIPGAVAGVLTVTSTTGSGWITLHPSDVGPGATSAVTWWGSGQTLSASFVMRAAPGRPSLNFRAPTLGVACGGSPGSSTDWIVDVTGYWWP